MKRLYLQLYLMLVASLLVLVLVAGVLWRTLLAESPGWRGSTLAAEIAAEILGDQTTPAGEQQAALERLAARHGLSATLHAPDHVKIAEAGRNPPGVAAADLRTGWNWRLDTGPLWVLDLRDGRRLVMRLPEEHRGHPALGLLSTLGLIALAVAAAAYPVTRRLTRRLERLRSSVEALGAGTLSVRVAVQGRDEVAALATSFNRAAAQIEALVGAHRTLLANASHELRSPLARVRMGVELAREGLAPERLAAIQADIAELDALIDEILLASRLEIVAGLDHTEPVDLLAVAAEEAARVGAAVEGDPVMVDGDARLLHRAARNLLENARRHGTADAIEVQVLPEGAGGLIRVSDRGPGVPAAEQERIFEPFYRPSGTRESSPGYGLGLTLVRQIARKHGGDVRCLAREGGGACFELRIRGALKARA